MNDVLPTEWAPEAPATCQRVEFPVAKFAVGAE